MPYDEYAIINTRRGKERVIKGKVENAQCSVYHNGSLYATYYIPPESFPYQSNNMTRWLHICLNEFKGARGFPVELAYRKIMDTVGVEYIINQGRGLLSGRDARSTQFTYVLADGYKIELKIDTRSYASITHEKYKRGEVVRKSKRQQLLEQEANEGKIRFCHPVTRFWLYMKTDGSGECGLSVVPDGEPTEQDLIIPEGAVL